MKIRIASLVLAAAALAACSQDAPDEAASAGAGAAPAIELENGWVRSTPGGSDITAAYFTLSNTGGADRLLGASSAQLDMIELHASSQDANNVMRMEHIDGAEIPANGETIFQPGGTHLMLYGAADMTLGDTVCLTLDFEISEDELACLPVMDDAPLP